MIYIENIGEKLKTCRKKNNITQADLAKKLNRSLRTVQHYESGNRMPKMETLKLLSEIFDVSLSYFLDDTYVEESKSDDRVFSIDSKLMNEIILNLAKSNELQSYLLLDGDIDLITEEVKRYIITLVNIFTQKNIKAVNREK